MSLLPSGIWAALAPGPRGLQMLRHWVVCVCVCVFSVLISSACLLKLASWDEICCAAALPKICSLFTTVSLPARVWPGRTLMRHLVLATKHLNNNSPKNKSQFCSNSKVKSTIRPPKTAISPARFPPMLLLFRFHRGTMRNYPCIINVHCTWTLTWSPFSVSLIFRKSRTHPWYFRSGHMGSFRRRWQPIYSWGLQDWLLKQHLHHHGRLKSSLGCVQTDTDTKNEKKKR